MDKLQLYITKSYEGFTHMTDFNAEDDVKATVCDITDAVKCITYDPEKKDIFYLLRSTDSGVFITLIRTIPTQIGDHLAAWLYIPSSASITSYDIEETINTIVEIISNPKISSDALNTLRRILDKEYDTLQSPGQTVANSGSVYAHRFYGAGTEYTLSDFIGTKRYQTTYLPYAGVILADRSKASAISGPDITSEPVEQMVRIFPPRTAVSTFRPNIFGRPFNKPFLVALMSTVDIVWKSPVETDVHQTIMVSQPNMRPEPISKSPTPAPAPTPTPAPEPKQPQPVPVIPVGQPQPVAPSPQPQTTGSHEEKASAAEETQTTPVSTPPAKPAPTSPVAPKPVTPKPGQSAGTQRIRSTMPQHKRSYIFKMPSIAPEVKGMVEFKVVTDGILSQCPIDGYELLEPLKDGEDKCNHLKYAPAPDKSMMIKCGVAGLLAGILLTLLCVWIFSGSSSAPKSTGPTVPADTITSNAQTEQTAETQVPEPQNTEPETPKATEQPQKSLQDALLYLDTHETWSKADMESYPDLKGLYDDMNNFRHAKLYGEWAKKLKGSKNYARVVKHSKLGKKKAPVVNGVKGSKNLVDPSAKQEFRVQTFCNAIDH